MLTALSVARDCHMIAKEDQVVLVTTTAPITSFNQSQLVATPALQAINQSQLTDDDKVQRSMEQFQKPEIQYTYASDTRAEEIDLQTPPPSATVLVCITY